jgi:hypothetical protein
MTYVLNEIRSFFHAECCNSWLILSDSIFNTLSRPMQLTLYLGVDRGPGKPRSFWAAPAPAGAKSKNGRGRWIIRAQKFEIEHDVWHNYTSVSQTFSYIEPNKLKLYRTLGYFPLIISHLIRLKYYKLSYNIDPPTPEYFLMFCERYINKVLPISDLNEIAWWTHKIV